jgi:hypothetical protein
MIWPSVFADGKEVDCNLGAHPLGRRTCQCRSPRLNDQETALSGDPLGRLTVRNVRIGKWLALEERCWQWPRTLSGPFHNAESLRALSIQGPFLQPSGSCAERRSIGSRSRGIME